MRWELKGDIATWPWEETIDEPLFQTNNIEKQRRVCRRFRDRISRD